MVLRSTLVAVVGLAGVGCGGFSSSGGGHFRAQQAPARPAAPVAQEPVAHPQPPGAPMPTVIAPVPTVIAQPQPPPPEIAVAPSGTPSYTFKLRNDGATDLLFSTEQGWQPVIFAYVGNPPAAHSAQLFPTACTQSCEAADPCAACATTPGEAKTVAVPGASVDVPWDGSLFVYAAAASSSSAKKSCRCWSRRLADPGQYNVKACGLRVPTGGGRFASTRPTCVETTMSVPAKGHSDVSLDFTK